jgi:replicative DNA helicase
MLPSATEPEPDPAAELIIAKHRNGPTAIIQLHFQGEFAMYREMVRETSTYA